MKLFTRTDAQITKETFRIFLSEMKRDKRRVLLFVILIPFGDLCYIVLMPFFISYITQSLITHPHDIATPLGLLGVMFVTTVVTLFSNHFGFTALFNHEESVTTRLAERAIDGLLRHGHEFFANQKVGSLAGDVNTFSRAYLQILDTIFLNGMSILVNFLASLIIIAVISPLMLIPLLITTGFVIIHSLHSLRTRAPYRNQRKEMQSKLFGSIADILGNHTLVRIFGKREVEIQRIVHERQAIEKVAATEIDLLQRNAEVRQGVLYTLQIITIGFCAILFVHSALSIAALIFIITYLGRITGSMFNITSIIRTIEQAFLDSSKVTEILITTPEVLDVNDAKPLVVTSGEIELRDIMFHYGDASSVNVFEHLNLTIPAGQRVGLVGKSGGGKTTLTNLLLRYMDVQSGSIMIDNHDISTITQDSLRNVISYVPQDPYLFHRTIRENVAYGADDDSDEAVFAALKRAEAYDFVMALPHGIDTTVGERGVKLSGGQRQRIAIARAILKDAPILVLDEATSALDSESEKLIQTSLEKLMKNRTSIVIAHRLSTIAKLDRILVLDHGHIVEDGSHRELIRHDGVYASLWKHQSGGFIEE